MSTSDPKYHPGNVPERVLLAARVLLERMPASKISMRELAREAGVSHAAPYRHFDDRAGFLCALAAHCFGEFIDEQRRAFEAAPSGARLLPVGLAYVEYATDHPYPFALIFDPSVSPGGSPPASHRPLIDAHAELLLTAIEDAIASGQLSDEAEPGDLGAAMWSVVHGLASLVPSGRIDRGHVTAILSALLLRPGP